MCEGGVNWGLVTRRKVFGGGVLLFGMNPASGKEGFLTNFMGAIRDVIGQLSPKLWLLLTFYDSCSLRSNRKTELD